MTQVRPEWSIDEVNLLREKYPTMSSNDLVKLFPTRSACGILRKAVNLHIPKKRDMSSNMILSDVGLVPAQRTRDFIGRFIAPPLPLRFWSKIQVKLLDNIELHHICKNPSCVNPDHLEQVTPEEHQEKENNFIAINRRRTHCIRGHPFSAENTCIYDGKRICRACAREYYHKHKV